MMRLWTAFGTTAYPESGDLLVISVAFTGKCAAHCLQGVLREMPHKDHALICHLVTLAYQQNRFDKQIAAR